MFTASLIYLNPPKFIGQDTAKCAGNPIKDECKTCLRFLLPVNSESTHQVWMGPWVMDEPCPSRKPAQ